MTARESEQREVFPHVAERIGEDPARFLDRAILDPNPALRRPKTGPDGEIRYVPNVDVADPLEFIADRIRGIDRLEVIMAWQGVEEQLVRTPKRGRPKVKELLQQRAAEILDDGGRDEQLQRRREVDPSRRTPPTFVDVDGEAYTADEWERRRGDVVEQRLKSIERPEQPEQPQETQEAQEPDEPEHLDVLDPDDLGGHNAALYRHVSREGPASLAGIQGAMANRDLSLEATEGLISFLVDEGYLAEIEPETYAAAEAREVAA